MTIDYLPPPGTPRDELDTPCLVLDLDAVDRNIEKMCAFVAERGLRYRPHAKTPKCPAICLKQLDAGAVGICAAKLGEAEALVAGGGRDVFITTEVIGLTKIPRLMSLCRAARIMVAVDDAANVEALSDAAQRLDADLGAMVEVNVRLDRCGVQPGQPAVDLAKIIADTPRLRFAGLMGYEGALRTSDREERRREAKLAIDKVLMTRAMIESAGLPVPIVSAGSTSTWNITSTFQGVTEIQPGPYVFMDGEYRRHTPDFETALFVLASVVSRPFKGKAIVDAGLTAISTDAGMPEIVSPSHATLTKLDQEHGHVALRGEAQALQRGDKVVILPSHGDTTVNLHDRYFGLRNQKLEAIYEITGRGRVR